MAFATLKLLQRIEILSLVTTMFVQSFLGPFRESCEPVVILIVEAEVIREFTADNEFLQESILGLFVHLLFLHFQRHPLR